MTGSNDVRVHAIWGAVVCVVALVVVDGATAATAAGALASALAYIAGYGTARGRAPPSA